MDGHLLVSDLQALVTETRRKNPEVKDASERALELLKGGAPAAAADGRNAEALLEPILLACKTKIPKIISISISALQRLTSLKGVPTSSVPTVIQTLTNVLNQGVDIQLRILQTLLAVLTHCGDVHSDILGNALLLCFKLQDSKTSVVSSTAAATLRQAVMLVFDRVGVEDAQPAPVPSSPLKSADLTVPASPGTLTLPTDPPTELQLSLSALDAYSIFSDLCLLTLNASPNPGSVSSFLSLGGGGNKEKPRMLKLSSLNRTFGLELIESVLSGFENGVKKHPELLHLLRYSLHPLLLKLLAEKPPSFPITLRVCRLVFLLLKSFADQLSDEAEIYLQLLMRLALGEAADPASLGAEHRDVTPVPGSSPMWLRVLALEIIRGICGDPALLSSIWSRYDNAKDADSPKLYSTLISTLNRLATEKPALLGVGSQMHGLGVPTSSTDGLHQSGSHAGGGYIDMGLGMVASAASVGVSTMSAMMASETTGLGPNSGMKLQLIEQHDKAEPPIIPDTYIYLLALHCLDAIADGFYNIVVPLFSSYVEQNQPGVTAPAALDTTQLPSGASRDTLQVVQGMASAGWPALLAALSYFIGTNLSDNHFADCLDAMQSFTIVCGVLGLETPRDAFLNTIARFAIPPPVVSAMQSYHDAPSTPRNNSVLSADALGFSALGVGSSFSGPPSLSERNLACLKTVIKTAQYLAGSLGDAWHDVLESLQSANYILVTRKVNPGRRSVAASPMITQASNKGRAPSTAQETSPLPRPAIFDNLDTDNIQLAINEIFDGTSELNDYSLSKFCTALCRLSAEMIGMDAGSNVIDLTDNKGGTPPLSPNESLSPGQSTDYLVSSHRRRASGMNTTQTLRAGERSFALTKLWSVAVRNMQRLTNLEPEMGWSTVTQHLLAVARHPTAPAVLRVQAAEILGDILVAAPQQVGSGSADQSRVQVQVFDVLTRQVDRYPVSNTVSTDYDVRSLGLRSVNQILESSGHSLVVGWRTIFSMLNGVCKGDGETLPASSRTGFSLQSNSSEISLASTTGRARPPPLSSTRGDANLVRVAFPSLTLICTDFLSSLNADDLRLCTTSLGFFGRQTDDVNITLAAIGLLWNVSDSIQITRRASDGQSTEEQDGVWLYLLGELQQLCSDPRLEVRNSAMQTLYRCLELYGGSLSPDMWTDVIWKIIFPLFDAVQMASGSTLDLHTKLLEESIDEDDAAERKRWDQSKMLVLSSTGSVFGTFLLGPIVTLPSFPGAYATLLQHLLRAFIEESRVVSTSALKSLSRILLAIGLDRDTSPDDIGAALEKTWSTVAQMGEALATNAHAAGTRGSEAPYTQESLLYLVQALTGLHDLEGKAWDLERLRQLSTILRCIMTYTRSPEYRPDVDSMSPVQSAVVDLLTAIDLTKAGTPSLILDELAGYTTLAYMGAFDYVDQSMGAGRKTTQKSVTFVALSKHCLPKMADVFDKHSGDVAVCNGGTTERVLAAYSIPVKLKYDCPPSCKFGDDPPLWKTAGANVVRVLSRTMVTFGSQEDAINEKRYEGIWAQIMEVVSAALLADSPPHQTQADRDAEEAAIQPVFDMLKSAIIPKMAHTRVPEHIVVQFSETLRKASSLWTYDVHGEEDDVSGTVADSVGNPQERVAFGCLDILVSTTSASGEDDVSEAQLRLARLVLPALLRRFRETLGSFLADSAIRGQMPFPRVREEELVYVLQQLLRLRLHPLSLTAEQAGLKPALAASPIAHLFSLYKPLLQLATTRFELPSIWVPDSTAARPINEATGETSEEHEEMVQVRAKDLAHECLEIIGEEIGLGI